MRFSPSSPAVLGLNPNLIEVAHKPFTGLIEFDLRAMVSDVIGMRTVSAISLSQADCMMMSISPLYFAIHPGMGDAHEDVVILGFCGPGRAGRSRPWCR